MPLLIGSAFTCLDRSLGGKKRQNGGYRSRPSSVYPAGRLRKFALSRQTGAPSSSSGLSGSAGRAGPGRGKVTSPYGSSLPPARPSVATPPAPLPRGPTYARGSPPSSAASAISRPCPRPAPLPAPEKQAAAAAAAAQ